MGRDKKFIKRIRFWNQSLEGRRVRRVSAIAYIDLWAPGIHLKTNRYRYESIHFDQRMGITDEHKFVWTKQTLRFRLYKG